MRQIMLKDTVERLPEVLSSLRADLDKCNAEHKILRDRKKFTDAGNLRNVVIRMLYAIQDRISAYLDGDLAISMKFPDKAQTLEDEIWEEEESDWATKELNFHSEKEDHWRERIVELEGHHPELAADRKYLGGKQYQRAMEFFRVVMIDSLPDPFQLKDKVPNVTGFLSGGLQHENWERAMVEITRVCLKNVSHPGLNYFIKHAGSIFRRLFLIALEDIKQGEKCSAEFKLIPNGLERFLIGEFDDMLWDLMVNVAGEVHSSLEPMYSSIDPNLPTFHGKRLGREEERNYYVKKGDEYVLVQSNAEDEMKKSWYDGITGRLAALVSGSGSAAKDYLREENRKRAVAKRSFLPDERAAMITDEETNTILRRSFEYIVGLLEFNLFVLKFQLNHHLYQGFKKALKSDLMTRVNDADWDTLFQPDPSIDARLEVLDDQIKGLGESLRDVQRMQRSI